MSEFDKLKDEGEQYAKDHPEQVKKGEGELESKLGLGQQDNAQQDNAQHDDAAPDKQDAAQDGN
jgi:hypothetical protein